MRNRTGCFRANSALPPEPRPSAWIWNKITQSIHIKYVKDVYKDKQYRAYAQTTKAWRDGRGGYPFAERWDPALVGAWRWYFPVKVPGVGPKGD